MTVICVNYFQFFIFYENMSFVIAVCSKFSL